MALGAAGMDARVLVVLEAVCMDARVLVVLDAAGYR